MSELGTVPTASKPYLAGMYAYQRLEAWKEAHRALMLTLKATDAAFHPRSRALFDQLKRAAISVEANIVEGYAREAGYLSPTVIRELEVNFGRTLATLSGLFKSLHPPRSKSASPRL